MNSSGLFRFQLAEAYRIFTAITALIAISTLPFQAWALTGDITGDGLLNVADVQCSVLAALDLTPNDPDTDPLCLSDRILSDIDCDEVTNVIDVQLLVGIVLGDLIGVHGIPDLKDLDDDNIHIGCDVCPEIADPDQLDSDGDEQGDLCDAFPNDPDNDIDSDGLGADVDNCPTITVGLELDTDGDNAIDACDDGNIENGDGCDANCTPTGCGNAVKTSGEACDDGNQIAADGCNGLCSAVEPGWTCTGSITSVCTQLPICAEDETGDDGSCYPEGGNPDLENCPSGDCEIVSDPFGGADPNAAQSCSPDEEGETRLCGVPRGICTQGLETCTDGVWGSCEGQGDPETETCDNEDDDCDGFTDEDLGTIQCGEGACMRSVVSCKDGVTQQCVTGPPQDEICNHIDDDCDNETDEEQPAELSCGEGLCHRSVPACTGFGPGHCEPGPPAEEICNGDDDDCDGITDEGMGDISCGTGKCQVVVSCVDGAYPDCVPGTPSEEICDQEDDDCDGTADEEIPNLICGVGGCARSHAACIEGDPQSCDAEMEGVASGEICNEVDDDCDDAIDEDLDCVDLACVDDDFVDPENPADCDDEEEGENNEPPYIRVDSTLIAADEVGDDNSCLNDNTMPDPSGDGGESVGGDPGGPPPGGPGFPPPDGSGDGSLITCSLNIGYGDPDGLLPELNVYWGDGVVESFPNEGCMVEEDPDTFRFQHNFAEGIYPVILEAVDQEGLEAQMKLDLIVTSANGGTCATVPPILFHIPDTYDDSFDGCLPLDGQNFCTLGNTPCPLDSDGLLTLQVLTLEPENTGNVNWMWDDTFTPITSPEISYACLSEGSYVGREVHIDPSEARSLAAVGGGGVRTATFNTGADGPEVEITAIGDFQVAAGESLELFAVPSDSSTEILSYRWTASDGRSPTYGEFFEGFFEDTGVYEVIVEATDVNFAKDYARAYIHVGMDREFITIDTSQSEDIVPDDGIHPQTVTIEIEGGLPLDQVEIWINARQNSLIPLWERVRGRILWEGTPDIMPGDDPNNLGKFSLVWEADSYTGSELLEIHDDSVATLDEEGRLRVTFAWVALPGAPMFPEINRNQDVAYRVRLMGMGWHGGEGANAAGWYNIPLNYALVPIVPMAGVIGTGVEEHGEYLQFTTTGSPTLIWLDSANEMQTLEGVGTWHFGDGTISTESGVKLYEYPGIYEAYYEVAYPNGWAAVSNAVEVLLLGDTDGDGILDHLDADKDNDGVCNDAEAVEGECTAGPDMLPHNPAQSEDQDGDGVGDNLDGCSLVPPDTPYEECRGDVFPNDPTEWLDTDQDGIGDNSDDDIDGDGLDNASELIYGTDPMVMDSDRDYLSDGYEVYSVWGPTQALEDSDGDGEANILDVDSDNDGISDGKEANPLDDADNDNLKNILDPDADNDGVLDGDDLSPQSWFRPASEPGFWRNYHPEGFIEGSYEWAAGGLFGTSEIRNQHYTISGEDEGSWSVVRQPSNQDVVNSDFSNATVLSKVNEQMEPSGMHCTELNTGDDNGFFPWITDADYTTNHSALFQKYYHFEYHTYWTLFSTDCHNSDPRELPDKNGDPFIYTIQSVTAAKGTDNTYTLQFTLDNDLAYLNSVHSYQQPVLNFAVYSSEPTDGNSLNDVQGRSLYQSSTTAMGYNATLTEPSAGLYKARITIPREHLPETGDNEYIKLWLYISPAWQTVQDEITSLHALDPADHNLKITGLVHQTAGFAAHLITRPRNAVHDLDPPTWYDVRRSILQIPADFQADPPTFPADQGPLGDVVDWSGTIANVGDYKIYTVNRLLDPDATLPDNVIYDSSIDAILFVTDKPQETSAFVHEEVRCSDDAACPWYAYDAPEDAEPTWIREGADIVFAQPYFDRTDVEPNQNGWDGMGDGLDSDEASGWIQENEVFIKGLAFSLKIHELSLQSTFPRTGEWLVKDSIRMKRKGGGPRPLFEISGEYAKDLDDMPDFDLSPTKRGKVGVKVKGKSFVEVVAGSWTDPVNKTGAIPPGAYDEGWDSGSKILKIQDDNPSTFRKIRPRGLAAAGLPLVLDTLDIYMGYQGAMAAYRQGDSIHALALGSTTLIQAGLTANEANAVAVAMRTKSAAPIEKAGKVSRYGGVAIAAIMSGYHAHKASQADSPIMRKYYATKAAVFALDSAVALAHPYAAVVEISWSVSGILYSGYVDNPAVDDLVGTPAAATTTMLTYFFTNEIPGAICKDARDKAEAVLYSDAEALSSFFSVLVIPPED